MNNDIYTLVLEKRPNDFMPIDINLLVNNIGMNDFYQIEKIDEFTKKYTKDEIYDLIKRANVVTEDYLNGKLEIINNKKYRFPILTKDINWSIDDFFKKYINDKQVMNKFINIYQKYSNNNIETLKEAIKEHDINIILKILFSLTYINVRNIYFYLYNQSEIDD